MFGQLADGFLALADPVTFLYLVGGFLLGIVFGAIPGLTPRLPSPCCCPLPSG